MRGLIAAALAATGALALAGGASAHAIVSPPVAEAGKLQQFTLSVPTEKEGVTTTKVELTVPSGFGIDSFEPPPAPWKMQVQSTGSGESTVIQKVTWTGGNTPTEQNAVFRFNADATKAQTYVFAVRQTYSDGSVADWTGPEGSDEPAPRVEAKSSLGGGGTDVLAIVALAVGALGLAVGVVALVARGGTGRPLA